MLRAARRGGLDGGGRLVPRAERIYTVIEALTADARDHSLDYKISGLRVTKGSWKGYIGLVKAATGDMVRIELQSEP